jgi:hypothetical protein
VQQETLKERGCCDGASLAPCQVGTLLLSGVDLVYESRRLAMRVVKFFDLAKSGEAPIATEAVRRFDQLFEIERTDKRRSNGLPRAMRNRDRSSSISKSGCTSSVPCSHLATTLRRRSTISSTAGRRSPASSTTVVFVCRTMRRNEPCGVRRWEERIGPSPVQMLAAIAPPPSTP